jgi:hypothetical protein
MNLQATPRGPENRRLDLKAFVPLIGKGTEFELEDEYDYDFGTIARVEGSLPFED